MKNILIASSPIIFLVVVLVCIFWFVPQRTKIIDQQTDTYEIVRIYRPKHFRLDLKNTRTGDVYQNVNVSKHFNSWQKLSTGMTMSLTMNIWEISDGSTSGAFNATEIRMACEELIRE